MQISSSNGNREFDLLGNLPRDVSMNILSRLPTPTIVGCKCVCKAWRDLIECGEFTNEHSHLIIIPHTTIFHNPEPVRIAPSSYKIEELNPNPYPNPKSPNPYNPNPNTTSIIHIGLVDSVSLVRSSVNGLILLLLQEREQEAAHQRIILSVCNPITREYVRIPNPPDRDLGPAQLAYPPDHAHLLHKPLYAPDTVHPPEYTKCSFGFGVSKISKQYKVVRISQSECRVYTLGTTGQWRSIAPGTGTSPRISNWNIKCAFEGGNLYWLDQLPPRSKYLTDISCFDLETEVFTSISTPPSRADLPYYCCRSLCALDGCIYLCDAYYDEIELWLLKGEREWTKIIEIRGPDFGRCHYLDYGYLVPVKLVGDGAMLVKNDRCSRTIYYYSSNKDVGGSGDGSRIEVLYTSALSKINMGFPAYGCPCSLVVYTPSFFPLRTLLVNTQEDVRSF